MDTLTAQDVSSPPQPPQPSRSSPPERPTSPRATTTSFSYPSSSATASGSPPAPPGHTIRRSITIDEASRLRGGASLTSHPSSENLESPSNGLRRRSSTFSDFSISEARRSMRDGTQDILNPSGAKHDMGQDSSGALANLPIAFALLPALVGVLFEGGSQLITDVMLLGLVFVFLRYTVTQPWQWYHSAQELRIRQEVGLEHVSEDGSESDIAPSKRASIVTLDDVPEETLQDEQQSSQPMQQHPETRRNLEGKSPVERPSRTRSQEAAVNELYVHEVLALVSCFLSPVIGAYLLHAIRNQLSRPSEGLLTNFNISVFLLAAELRPLSHALKLIQARTLHLQRIVRLTPTPASTKEQLEEMRLRVAQLELRAEAAEAVTAQSLEISAQRQQQQQNSSLKQGPALVREVRNAIQPELDALNRAVRRYEKKATVLALQTESRLGAVDTRLSDAIALAAAAAKQSDQSQWSYTALLRWAVAAKRIVKKRRSTVRARKIWTGLWKGIKTRLRIGKGPI
ncbi:hypothetical protein J7T55_007492 [Diaporthe amygdali]|uniref:uncharacterized protein n=1 Tax=Phomopsis amygdali TaxID=1214568 RepID=UPI0022FED8B5|nr:uncharacterized protein J7T55_007492 [Diaporthe amygdali]KAJ0116512.1 hypothetical protein J7T55_007492 [Diaporthe amygdali]